MRVAVSHFKEKAHWNPALGLLLFAWDGTDTFFFCRQDGAPSLSDDITAHLRVYVCVCVCV